MLSYLLLTVVATWPLALDFGGHIYGAPHGDGIGGIAYFNAWKTSILQGHPGRDPLLSYPFGANLRSALVPPMYFFIELPLTFLFGGAGAYNVLAFLCFPLSAIGSYVLCRVLRISPPASAAAGVFYGFTAYHAAHAAGHTTLPHTEFFPLVLAAFLLWRNQGGILRALVAALALTMTLTWDYYYAVFVVLMMAAAGVSWVVADVAHRGLPAALLRGVKLAGIGALGVTLALPLFAFAKSQVPGNALSSRTPAEILIFSAKPCQLLQPWIFHPQLGGLACPTNGLPPAEVGLYLGLSAVALALFFLVGSAWRGLPGNISSELWVLVPVGLVAAAWSFPALWQSLIHTSPPALLWKYVPGLRVNSRAMVLFQMATAVMAGAGLEGIVRARGWMLPRPSLRRLGGNLAARPGRSAWLICGVAAGVFFFESIGISSAAEPLPHPAVVDWLASRPRGTVIINYPGAWPNTYSEGTGYFYAYYHDRVQLPEIGTLLGTPNAGSDLAAELWVAGPATASELSTMGVRYAVSHTSEAYDLRRHPDVLQGLPGFRRVYSADGDVVYEVTAAPRPFAYLTGDFQVLEEHPQEGYARWMGKSGRIAVENPFQHSVKAVLRLEMWELSHNENKVVVRGDGLDQHLAATTGPQDVRVTLPPGRSFVELVPPTPPRPVSGSEDRLVTLYVFRPVVTS